MQRFLGSSKVCTVDPVCFRQNNQHQNCLIFPMENFQSIGNVENPLFFFYFKTEAWSTDLGFERQYLQALSGESLGAQSLDQGLRTELAASLQTRQLACLPCEAGQVSHSQSARRGISRVGGW